MMFRVLSTLIGISIVCLFAMLSCKHQMSSADGSVAGLNDIPLEMTMQAGWQLLDALIVEVEDELKPYAFTVLTQHGLKTFKRMREYIAIHQSIDSSDSNAIGFAEINACAMNVDQVLWKPDLSSLNSYTNLTHLDDLAGVIKRNGGIVVELPKAGSPYTVSGADDPLIQFFNQQTEAAKRLPQGFFASGVPPGIVVLGYHDTKQGPASGHSAIVGDVDKNGTVMVYHNNWYRPESDKYGKRYRFMIRIASMYHGHQKVRDWMPTPWLWFGRDRVDNQLINQIKSITPAVDDLDPLNSNYTIKLAIPQSIIEDFENKNFVPHFTPETQLNHGHTNVHSEDIADPEAGYEICRVNLSLTDTSISLKDFFDSHKHPDLPLPQRWQNILNERDNEENEDKRNYERQMELYRHHNREDQYQENYELVSFYRKPKSSPSQQQFFDVYLKKSSFTDNPTEFNKVFCTTKEKMLELNHAELAQMYN